MAHHLLLRHCIYVAYLAMLMATNVIALLFVLALYANFYALIIHFHVVIFYCALGVCSSYQATSAQTTKSG